jgi:hypothetical protein
MTTLLIGYGTLLYRASLGQSIGAEIAQAKQLTPVLIRDYRRLFNVRAEHYESTNRFGDGGIEIGAVNVEPAPGSSFNGVAMPVSTEELAILDLRERYYRRVTAPVYEFTSGECLGTGHFYAAETDSIWIERDPPRLLPRWQDVVWARSGAYEISPSFGRVYDATTYMADGKTLMVDFYREHLMEAGGPALP